MRRYGERSLKKSKIAGGNVQPSFFARQVFHALSTSLSNRARSFTVFPERLWLYLYVNPPSVSVPVILEEGVSCVIFSVEDRLPLFTALAGSEVSIRSSS